VRLKLFLSSLILSSAALLASPATAREAAKMMTLSTGSNVATWTLSPATSQSVRARTTPIVYLHGGPGLYTEDRRIEMGRAFVDAGFTAVFYDQIGSGQSARIPATQYTLARMVADLEALRVSLGAEKMVLWGNSWGAQLALMYAQAHPNHAAGFVLTSPGNFPGETFRRDYSVTKRTNVTIGSPLTAAINQIDRKGGAAEPAVSQIESGRLLDAVTSADLLEGMVCKTSDVAQETLPGGGNLFVNRMVQKEVASVRTTWTTLPRVPTLILRGSCDFIAPASANRYASVLGSNVTPLTNIGHGLIEDPVQVRNVLNAFAIGPLADVP
jgi:pimeloyl-ACP methyl ester carboxylesterase